MQTARYDPAFQVLNNIRSKEVDGDLLRAMDDDEVCGKPMTRSAGLGFKN